MTKTFSATAPNQGGGGIALSGGSNNSLTNNTVNSNLAGGIGCQSNPGAVFVSGIRVDRKPQDAARPRAARRLLRHEDVHDPAAIPSQCLPKNRPSAAIMIRSFFIVRFCSPMSDRWPHGPHV